MTVLKIITWWLAAPFSLTALWCIAVYASDLIKAMGQRIVAQAR